MDAAERLSVQGLELEVVRRGAGRPVLLLHGPENVHPRAPFLELLGKHAEIIAPSHPGFSHSPLPEDFDTVYDLVHLYLGVLEALPYDRVTLLGLSFGGWLAAEIVATCRHRFGQHDRGRTHPAPPGPIDKDAPRPYSPVPRGDPDNTNLPGEAWR